MKNKHKGSTDINFNMSSKVTKGKAVGTTDMGIPPFTQKPKNIEKLHTSASIDKKSKHGTDKYS
jgi:hypothetical protein